MRIGVVIAVLAIAILQGSCRPVGAPSASATAPSAGGPPAFKSLKVTVIRDPDWTFERQSSGTHLFLCSTNACEIGSRARIEVGPNVKPNVERAEIEETAKKMLADRSLKFLRSEVGTFQGFPVHNFERVIEDQGSPKYYAGSYVSAGKVLVSVISIASTAAQARKNVDSRLRLVAIER